MARAIYQDGDIYLLDDPISALDGYISEKVFNLAILSLKSKKTLVMVTNNKSLMGYFDRVLEMVYNDDSNVEYLAINNNLQAVAESKEVELQNLHKKKFAKIAEIPVQEIDRLRTDSIRLKMLKS